MSITLGSNFSLQTTLPLDDRTVVADNTARNAILAGRRYEGLIVYSIAAATCYQLVGGILDANWAVIGGGGGGSGNGFTPTGPFSVTNNSSSALSGETTASATYTQVDYIARVVRGTTVFVRCEFSIIFRNSAWEVQLGMERGLNPSGITWTVDATTGQVTAAADNGAGNATINLQKINWPA